jgi:hypothetical protein
MKRDKTFGTDLGTAVDRLKAMAAEAGDALLTEGPVNPDYKLLDLCAEIGYRRKLADAASKRRSAAPWAHWMCKTPEQKLEYAEANAENESASKGYSHLLRQASKLQATTAAGIYAKAIAVRASKTGSQLLAMSLAEDLLACPGLRASLWPAQEEE